MKLGLTLAAMGIFCAFGGNVCLLCGAAEHFTPVHVSQCHYTQLVTGALVTWLIWRETPTVWMIGGSVLIMAAGLLMAVALSRESVDSRPEVFVGPGWDLPSGRGGSSGVTSLRMTAFVHESQTQDTSCAYIS